MPRCSTNAGYCPPASASPNPARTACRTTSSRTLRPFTNRNCRSGRARAALGGPRYPCIERSPASKSISSAPAANSSPTSLESRRRGSMRCVASTTLRASWCNVNETSGRASARRRTASSACRSSVRGVRRNLRRAGTLKKRSRTSTTVPAFAAAGSTAETVPPSTRTRAPLSASCGRLASTSLDTEAMLGSASPRNPMLRMRSRSSRVAILLVAWRDSARTSSPEGIPNPSSRTRIRRAPPVSSSTAIVLAPASSAFSTSSLTTDAGRSTTSPAAIWFARTAERVLIGAGAAGPGSLIALDRRRSGSTEIRLLDARQPCGRAERPRCDIPLRP